MNAVQNFQNFNNSFWGGINSAVQDVADLIGLGSARRNREFEAEQAQKQMDYQTNSMYLASELNQKSADIAWEREMQASNTQYQRAVADLKEAGLNPTLALTGGASTPSASAMSVNSQSGAKGNGSSAGVGALLGAMTSMMNSASKIAKYS